MGKNLSLIWELDSIFSGGSHSKELKKAFSSIENYLSDLKKCISHSIEEAITLFQKTSLLLREVEAFIHCLNAQNTNDIQAHILQDQIIRYKATFSTLGVMLDEHLRTLDDGVFHKLLELPSLKPISFPLIERRKLAKEKLPSSYEALINDLAIDGYHGWNQLYETLMGEMTFSFEGKNLSFGQIENKVSDPNRKIRVQALALIDKNFSEKQNLCAQALNHIGGFRLQLYEKRGIKDLLQEPLEMNRMEEITLKTMWEVINKNKAPLLEYLKCKADLLKIKKCSWCDLSAPLGHSYKPISYESASSLILESFQTFGLKMAKFAEEILTNHSIDAEDRPLKRAGGFCVDFPKSKKSRIFLTYGQTMNNVFTLAHEIGHAFHNVVIHPLPEMAQHIKMNVAETASTLAEMIVAKTATSKATSTQENLLLLDDQASRSVSFLLNIQARFLFEQAFYEERKKGYIPSDRLSELMLFAQKEAFGDSLEGWHPLFWATKLHFYFTDIPFYNFPYTFGYLFSSGIYSSGKNDLDIENKYIALLQDTGQMNVEDLALKHLDVDLKKPDFWQNGLNLVTDEIQQFLDLAK